MTFFVFPWIVNTAANCVSLWCSRLTNHPKVGTKWWIKDAWQIKGTKKNSKEPLSKTHYIINDHSPAAFLNIETHPHLSRRDSQVVDFKLDSEKCQSFSKFFFGHFRSKNTMNDKKFSQKILLCCKLQFSIRKWHKYKFKNTILGLSSKFFVRIGVIFDSSIWNLYVFIGKI